MQETLYDLKNGKIVNWKGRKIDSELLGESYFRLGMVSKAIRVQQCSSWLEFKEFTDGTKKLHKSDFCKVRLCPMCSWRRSKKVFGQVSKVMDYMELKEKYKYIFLTLTAKNVPGEVLSDEIDKYFYAFKLLVARKEFKKVVKGWFRCFEVTHNWQRDDYHPHFHIVLAVDEDYAQRDKQYIPHSQWVQLWKSCMGIDYDPSVKVNMIKPIGDNEKDYKKAVAEVAKYAVKAGDYIFNLVKEQESLMRIESVRKECEKLTDECVKIIDTALHNRRLIASGGKFKEIHKLLNLDDALDGDLINTDNEDEIRSDLAYILVRYVWKKNFKDYYKLEKELTEDEK